MVNFLDIKYSPKEIVQKRNLILEKVFKKCDLDCVNFTKITPKLIRKTFKLYDKYFFDNAIRKLLDHYKMTIEYKPSNTLSSTAGKVFIKNYHVKFEISNKIISNLFTNKKDKKLSLGGLFCKNRLQCFQIVCEHEMIHVVQIIYYNDRFIKEGPHGAVFKELVKNIFGHTDIKHYLRLGDISQHKNKETSKTIQLGDIVTYNIFDRKTKKNLTYKGVVVEKNNKKTVIQDCEKFIGFVIPYHLLQKTGKKTKTTPLEDYKKTLNKNQIVTAIINDKPMKFKIVELRAKKFVGINLETDKQWIISYNAIKKKKMIYLV